MNYSKKNIKYLVKKNGTKKQFEELTGISINTLKNIINKKSTPSIDTLIQIHDTLEISIDDLIFKDLEEINNNNKENN